MHKTIFIALAALAAGAAAAQKDPTAAQAPVPLLEYRSAFDGYRPFAAEKVAPWRNSNDAKAPREDKSKPEAKPPASTHGGHR